MISTDPAQFVQAVKPLLESKDVPGLISMLRYRWSSEQLAEMLECDDPSARKVALLAVSLVGDASMVEMLTRQLKDSDPVVNEMAEHALWSIWFRSGTAQANHELGRGTQAANAREYRHAIEHFDRALSLDPECAEAYHQRALARYMLEELELSVADSLKAVELMPSHFAAWANLGHCYVNICDWPKAVNYYRRALEINPHMDSVREVIDELIRLQDPES